MSYGSFSRTTTATYTQARRLAARIASELTQLQALYGRPTDSHLENLASEAEQFILAGYLDHIRYGFQRNGRVILELQYTAEDATGTDDKPGRIPVGVDVTGASWFSYLVTSQRWSNRSQAERDAFERGLPFIRSDAAAPEYAPGIVDRGSKHYSEDTMGLRKEVRSI